MAKKNFNLSKNPLKHIGTLSEDNKFQIYDRKSDKTFEATIQQILDLVPAPGGGIPDEQTFTLNTLPFTSSVVNGEEFDLLFFNNITKEIDTATFTCTGEIWITEAGGTTYTFFNGQAYAEGYADPLICGSYSSIDDGAGTLLISLEKFQNGGLVKQTIYNGNTSITSEILEIISGDIDRPNKIFSKYENGSSISEKDFTVDLDPTTDIQKSVYLFYNDGITSTTNYAPLYQYAEVNISSAEILAFDGTPVTLLAAPGVNKYYIIDAIILEYTHNTTAYTFSDYIAIRESGGDAIATIAGLITSGVNKVSVVKVDGTNLDTSPLLNGYFIASTLNSAVTLDSWGGGAATLGDGTIKVKIWYRVMTFG